MQVVTMVLVFCLSWGPYALLSLIGILGYSEVSTHTFVLFFFPFKPMMQCTIAGLDGPPVCDGVPDYAGEILNFVEPCHLHLYEQKCE